MPFADVVKKVGDWRTRPKRKRDPVIHKEYMKRYRAARRAEGKPPPLCFVVQTDDETMAEVLVHVERNRVSISELIRTYIAWGLENDPA